MNFLAALRHCQSRAARLAAAVFAVGWLGLAVAPCQAMGSAPDEAPHHGSQPMDDCGHCPPATGTTPDCAEAAPVDCGPAAQPALEPRQPDQPQSAACIPAHEFTFEFAPAPRALRPPAFAAPPLPQASLQQRYCSFLK